MGVDDVIVNPGPRSIRLYRGKPVRRMHLMVKSTGALCNLDCSYCYYLSKQELLGKLEQWRMSDETLEAFIRQYFEGQNYKAKGWLGEKTHVDVPYLIKLRLDPFERQGWPNNGTKEGAQQYFDSFRFQFWRFVFVQQVIAKVIQTFLDYPPMQGGASFNLDAVKVEMAKRMEEAERASKGPGN
jgi:hypothetical protein